MSNVIEVRDGKISDLFAKLSKKTKKMRPVMNDIGALIHDSVMENFEQEGRPKWADLRPSTKAIRKKVGKWPGQMLNMHGASGLLGSINYRAEDDRVSVGTNKVYARVLQFGANKGQFGKRSVVQQVRAHSRKIRGKKQNIAAHTRRATVLTPFGKIAPRPFLMLQKQDYKDIADTISNYLAKG